MDIPLRWKTRFGRAALLASAALLAGCQEPKEIIPVAPPGLELTRVPTVKGAEAEALGEQPAVESRQGKVDLSDKGAPPTPVGQPTTTPSGLIYETLQPGTGAEAHRGQEIVMHYTGRLEDGTVFDSAEGAKTFPTTIGVGRVIAGWDQGVPGMRVGEKRKLTIPSPLGYGSRGSPPKIPGGATLVFEVELLEVK